jgi:hypothetical protein
MDVLRTVLPAKYSPLQPGGHRLQSIYQTEVSSNFAQVLAGLIGSDSTSLMRGIGWTTEPSAHAAKPASALGLPVEHRL